MSSERERAGARAEAGCGAQRVTLIPGDGIGPEVTEAALAVLAAAGVEIAWERVEAGAEVVAKYGTPVPEAALHSIRTNGVALKGPIGTPIGGGFKSANVTLRQSLDLYASVRPVKNLPGVPSRYEGVDLIVVRENTEGLYSGLEHRVAPGIVESLKIVTEAASLRIARYAFALAEREGRREVCTVHKANILKLSDGLFLECAQRVARDHPRIAYREIIIDNCCMQLVKDPTQFDVLLLENLYGDILSDLCAGLVGGLGVVPGANVGESCAVFEAVHGSAPDIAGRRVANPAAVILSAAMLARHLGEGSKAAAIERAVAAALVDPANHPRDLGGSADLDRVTRAIVEHLGDEIGDVDCLSFHGGGNGPGRTEANPAPCHRSRTEADRAEPKRTRPLPSDRVRKSTNSMNVPASVPVSASVRVARRPTLVLGLDGATFAVMRPLFAAGRLPNLARWMEEGAAAVLHSTVPPVSFPAWSSFATGLDPGAHGLFDFTQKLPGRYAIRFTNATDRSGATLFGRATAAEQRVLALGMPATFPPESVNGFLLAGFDAPVSTGSTARAASDPAFYEAVAARVGPWMAAAPDEGASAEGWHDAAAERLVLRVHQKRKFALEALAQLYVKDMAPDLVCVVFSESDTVAHHFWRDHDPLSPRHDKDTSTLRRLAVSSVYEALDAACGELREALGPEAACFVVSDHGAGGASRRVVHLNQRLAECGLLGFRAAGGVDRAARAVRDAALRILPPRAREAAFRRLRPAAARLESAARFGGIDWRRTAAFSEEANTQPGVWLNLAGREAEGRVAAADYERVREDVIAALLDWKLPDGGGAVVARARRREEVYSGPLVERAPDVVVELGLDAGYGLSLVPTPRGVSAPSLRTLEPHELAGGRGRGMNGTHRPEGIWIEHGTGAAAFPGGHGRLADAAAPILRALDLGPESGAAPPSAPRAYTPEEEAIVAERLRRLGYLE